MAERSPGELPRQPALVAINGVLQSGWRYGVDVAGEECLLELVAPDDDGWIAVGPDLFDCLLELRRSTEQLGIVVCCNGARLNAWSSQSQREDLRGLGVYLLELGERNPRPPALETLADAPLHAVVEVEAQIAFAQSWYDSLR